jgi:hypothetical protein
MRTAMLGSWVIFAETVLQIFEILWDAVDDLIGGGSTRGSTYSREAAPSGAGAPASLG